MTTTELSETVQYHLRELKLSSDPDDPRSILPDFKPHHKVILDIGCGVGQTFIAAGLDQDQSRLLIGLDNELEPVQYGTVHFGTIKFINGLGDKLPLKSGSVDMVISRVTIPYTNIPVTLSEINRVLKPGGEVWMTLHSIRVLINPLVKSFKAVSLKGVVVRSFFLFNGLLLHCFGKILPLPGSGAYESFQTSSAIRRLLKKTGFQHIDISRDKHFLVTATKPLD